jgi:hypothetical protein
MVVGGNGLSSADICMPPSIDSQTVATLFQSQIASAIAATLPDRFVIPQLGSNVEKTFNKEQLQNLQFARQTLYLAPLISLVLLLLIVLFAVRSRRALMRWWSMPLLVTAILAGAGALSAPPLVSWYLGQTLAANNGLSPRMLDLIIRVANTLAANVGGLVAAIAVALGGVGVVMMLASNIIPDSPARAKIKAAGEIPASNSKPEKKISSTLITLAVLLPVILVILAALVLVVGWLVNQGLLIL